MPKTTKKPVKVTKKAAPSISKVPVKSKVVSATTKTVAMAPKAAAAKSKKPTKPVAAPAKKAAADKDSIKGKLKAVGEMIFGKDSKNAKGTKVPPTKPVAASKAAEKTAVKADGKKAGGAASVPTAAPAKAAKTEKVVAVLAKPAKGKAAKVYLDNGEKMCRESGCENIASTKNYCRLDYIKNWKKIKRKEMILKEGKLNNYIDELVSKYPDKYVEIIRQDLSSEVNFTKVVHDLELDESIDDLDYDGDSIDALIGGIRKEDDIDDSDF